MQHWLRVLVLGLPGVLAAQEGDQAALSIKEAGREIGHEDFTLRPARPRRPVGDSLIMVARYPETRPLITIQGVLQLSTKGIPLSLSLDYQNGRQGETFLTSVSRTRVTVRRVARGAESARELPGGDPIVLLDDSLFATYLSMVPVATEAPKTVTAIFPRTARRMTLSIKRSTLAAGRADEAQTAIEFTGDVTGQLLLDSAGHFVKLELPGRQIEVSRLPK
jgi:hypothetical protein